MKNTTNHCAIVVLAAGSSRRLGQAKQWLPMGSSHLLGHTLQAALRTGWHPVVLVAAPGMEPAMLPTLQQQAVVWIENSQHQEGMASSIRAGIGYLQQQAPEVQAAAILVCDQPYIHTDVLKRLYQLLQQPGGYSIAACSYAGRLGTPAIFNRQHWPALLNLQGDTGARQLLQAAGEQVASLPFAQGEADIDTWEDYEKWVKNSQY